MSWIGRLLRGGDVRLPTDRTSPGQYNFDAGGWPVFVWHAEQHGYKVRAVCSWLRGRQRFSWERPDSVIIQRGDACIELSVFQVELEGDGLWPMLDDMFARQEDAPMTKNAGFKWKVRELAAQEGIRYTEALRRLTEQETPVVHGTLRDSVPVVDGVAVVEPGPYRHPEFGSAPRRDSLEVFLRPMDGLL